MFSKIHFSNLLDPDNPPNSWSIYSISCKCGLSYIGQTKRAFKFRINTWSSFKNTETIKLAKQCWDLSIRFDFTAEKTLYKHHFIAELDFLQSFAIQNFFFFFSLILVLLCPLYSLDENLSFVPPFNF